MEGIFIFLGKGKPKKSLTFEGFPSIPNLVIVKGSARALHPELHNTPGQLRPECGYLQELIVILNHLPEKLEVLGKYSFFQLGWEALY